MGKGDILFVCFFRMHFLCFNFGGGLHFNMGTEFKDLFFINLHLDFNIYINRNSTNAN